MRNRRDVMWPASAVCAWLLVTASLEFYFHRVRPALRPDPAEGNGRAPAANFSDEAPPGGPARRPGALAHGLVGSATRRADEDEEKVPPAPPEAAASEQPEEIRDAPANLPEEQPSDAREISRARGSAAPGALPAEKEVHPLRRYQPPIWRQVSRQVLRGRSTTLRAAPMRLRAGTPFSSSSGSGQRAPRPYRVGVWSPKFPGRPVPGDARSRDKIAPAARENSAESSTHPLLRTGRAAPGGVIGVRDSRDSADAGLRTPKAPIMRRRPSENERGERGGTRGARRKPGPSDSWLAALGGRRTTSSRQRMQPLLEAPPWDGEEEDDVQKSRKALRPRFIRTRKPPAGSRRRDGREHPNREPSLKRLLGPSPLKPPAQVPRDPDFSEARKSRPPFSTTETAASWAPATMRDIENLRPPNESPRFKTWNREDADGLPHLHAEGEVQYWHQGNVWAAASHGRWAWLERGSGRWWALAEGQPKPAVWHGRHWWWKSDNVWSLVDQGEPWTYQSFGNWGLDGLAHPPTGTRVVYGADGSRAAIVSPEKGVVMYDLPSGREIGRWDDSSDESASETGPN